MGHLIRNVCTELFGKGDGTILGGELTDRGETMTEPEEKPFQLRSTRSYMIGQLRARKYALEFANTLKDSENPYGECGKFTEKLWKDTSRHTKEFYRHLCKELLYVIEAFMPSRNDPWMYNLTMESLIKLFQPYKQD